MSAPQLPSQARVVVIGGGVIGTSVAYHLAHAGWNDVVLLERDRLTSGTTWHAAGLINAYGSFSETSTAMRLYTRDLYARLEAETGLSTGFHPCGYIQVAIDEDRLEEYRRVSTFNRHCGVECYEISPTEVRQRFPLARVEDVLAGFFVPGDGRGNPVDITMALAKGARMQGATILEGVPNSPLDRSWRALLNEAIDAPADDLAGLVFGWAAPSGDEIGEQIDATIDAALLGDDAPAVVALEAGQTSDTVSRLVERITELQRVVERLEDEAADAPRVTVVRADADRGIDWFRPFRNIARGLGGILSIIVTIGVLFGIGFATIFFGGRRYIEGVADTARNATTRSLLVGLAAAFLIVPAFIVGGLALVISIVGIPALLVWAPMFPVATALAILLGYLSVAHAAGEALAERRFYAADWFQRGNSYYFLLTGLTMLTALFIAAQFVSMAGRWLGFFTAILTGLGVVVTLASLSIGLGAVLLSRAGTRPIRTSGGRMADPEMFAEPTHV
jgi:hypothetical protein